MFWFALLLVHSALCAPVKHEVKVPIGDSVTIESPGYPEGAPLETNIVWELTTEADAQIELVCEDLRISPTDNEEDRCEKGYLKIGEEGERPEGEGKYCGSAEGTIATSKQNKLQLEFDLTFASGLFKCSAKGVKKEEEVEAVLPRTAMDQTEVNIKVGDPGYDQIYFPTLPRGMSKTWVFKTNQGARFSLFCKTFKISNGARCKDEEMTVTSGGKSKQYCGQEYDLDYRSETNEMKVFLKTSNERGAINCIVQAINGPKKHQYMNVKSFEVDSREHGGPKGTKSTNCNCGWSNKNKNAARIVNGKEAKENEFPWMVALLSYRFQFCGGSIISKRHVLTAAHCTAGKSASDIQILAGANNWLNVETGQLQDVAKIIDHSYDKYKAHVNDISVLVLKGDLKFNQNVGPVCLSKQQPNIDNKYVTLSGWGLLGKGMDQAERLRTTHMRVVDYPTCNFIYGDRFSRETPNRLCTWASNRDSCQGDSGGPLVWLDPETNRYTQMGLVSFGRGCNVDDPKINTLVSAYYDWIQKAVEGSNGEVCHKV